MSEDTYFRWGKEVDWIRRQSITREDLEQFPAKQMAYLVDVWDSHFRDKHQQYPNGVPIPVFIHKLRQVRHEPLYRGLYVGVFDFILDLGAAEGARAFGREIYINRAEREDRRQFLRMTVGTAAAIGAMFWGLPKLFPSRRSPQPVAQEPKEDKFRREAAIYGSLVLALSYEQRQKAVATLDDTLRRAESLDAMFTELTPQRLSDGKYCMRVASAFCGSAHATSVAVDDLIRDCGVTRIRRGYLVQYDGRFNNLFLAAAIAARLKTGGAQGLRELSSAVGPYAEHHRELRDAYGRAREVLLKQTPGWDDRQQIADIAIAVKRLADGSEDLQARISRWAVPVKSDIAKSAGQPERRGAGN